MLDKYLLKQILLEQKEEITRLLKGSAVARDAYPAAKKLLNSDLIKAVIGIRRCGKSFLSHQLLAGKKYGYVNFDDERFIGAKTDDLNSFFEVIKEMEPKTTHLLLDEIQNITGWELFVNRLKRSGYNIVVTGSNSRMLSKELATHLTGRHYTIELYPFSFSEYLAVKGVSFAENDFFKTETRAVIRKTLEEYLSEGGFPEAVGLENSGEYLRNLFDKIITRDIVERYGVKHVRDLKEIALLAVSYFGAKFSYHKIRKIFEVKSVHTVKNYMDYLEQSYLVFQLAPFSFKHTEMVRQARKLYCIDTGMINAIVPRVTVDRGRLIENAVFLQLKRRGKEVYFYAQPDFEIDFLVRSGTRIEQAIQVCFSMSDPETRKRELKSLLKASEKFDCRELLIITWDEEGEEVSDLKKIRIVPLWKWLLQSQ